MPPKKKQDTTTAAAAAATPASNAKSGLVLSKRWKLGALLGEGACGQVFEVADITGTQNQHAWVMKLAPLPPAPAPGAARKKNKTHDAMKRNADTLYMEQLVYKNYLMGVPNVPELPVTLSYGEDQGFRFLVMQRLGQDLTQAFQAHGRYFAPALLADMGKQMLGGLQRLHERQLLFIDVKPENFMLGLPGTPEAKTVFLVDFGLVEKYTASSGAHKPQEGLGAAGGGVGTPLFSSLACHQGTPAGRRDDLEALGLVLLFFARGGHFPWATATSDADCLAQKKKASLAELCQGVAGAAQLQAFVELARKTAFEAVPDYAAFEKLLVALGKVKDPKAGSGGGGMVGALLNAVVGGGRKRKSGAAGASPNENHLDAANMKSSGGGDGGKKKKKARGEGGGGGGGEVIEIDDDDDEDDTQSVASTASKSACLSLQVIEGPHKGAVFSLGSLEKAVFIGSDAKQAVALPQDGAVGAKHVKLESSGRDSVHSLKVLPVGGEVSVNNVAVGKSGRVIFAGDLLKVGNTTLALRRA